MIVASWDCPLCVVDINSLSLSLMGNCGFQACSCADTQRKRGRACLTPHLNRFFLISSCPPYSSHLHTQSSESCFLPLGLEILLALPWSFAPESWTGWDPKVLKPRGQQVKGKCAQPPSGGSAGPGLQSRRQARGTAQPWGDGRSGPDGSRSAFSLCHRVSKPHQGCLERCFWVLLQESPPLCVLRGFLLC